MKNFFISLFFFSTLCINAQSDTLISPKKSVIALDKVKTIYRGIANPISIAVSDCKSYKVEGIGLEEVSKGKYALFPKIESGEKVNIYVTITNYDNTIIIEKHLFLIKDLPLIMTKINNQNCHYCAVELTKEQIRNSIISVGWNDVNLDLEDKYYKVIGFTIYIVGIENIKVEGNRFTEESMKEINKLEVGDEFYILKVRYPKRNNGFRMDPNAIKIRINE